MSESGLGDNAQAIEFSENTTTSAQKEALYNQFSSIWAKQITY